VCSPIINAFDTAVILNQQSLDKFESKVKPGGYLLYDPNGITKKPTRTDIHIHTIEGAQLASDMGNSKVFNMIILGAFLKLRPIILDKNVEEGLRHSLPERAHKLIPLNMEAVKVGKDNVK
jgi:2-oxoglutarate ferredoxin oxidoreductase subunit gamma